MSTTYGPIIFPGPGQILTVDISQETAAMIVENQSLQDVLFSVAPATPQVVTQSNVVAGIAAGLPITNGGWDLHVGPRQAAVLQIPDSSKTETAHGRYWTGVVWIQQVNITNAQITAGSFVSNPGANVWVTAYGPGEKIPDAGLTSVGYFLASQERYIAVPVTAFFHEDANGIVLSAGSTWTNVAGGTAIGNFPFSNAALTAGIAVSGTFYVLLYFVLASMQNLSAVAGTAEAQVIQMRMACFDSGSNLLNSALFFGQYFAHLALQNRCESLWQPPQPIAVPLTVAVGTGPPYTVHLQIQVFGMVGGGGTNIKPMDIRVYYDVTPIYPPGASGGIAGFTPGGIYNGFVY